MSSTKQGLRMGKRGAWHRKIERLLRELGYRLDGLDSRSHFVWVHPTGGEIHVSSSPRTETEEQWIRRELRRRHPGHPALGPVRKAPTKASRLVQRQHKPRRALVMVPAKRETPKAPPSTRPAKTACVKCGRRWLSDLDPRGRECPACGGEVRLGRDRDGVTLRLAA